MLINYKVFDKDLKNINLDTVSIINTINPHSYCVSKKDKEAGVIVLIFMSSTNF